MFPRIFAVVAWLLVTTAAAEPLRIAGTGASQNLLRDAADAFGAAQPECQVEVPDSTGSRGGIRALRDGKAELARVSRSPDEIELGTELGYRLFAESEVVFAVHASVTGVRWLSTEQLRAIYAGETRDWEEVGGPRHTVYPLIRDGGTTLRTVLKHIPQFERLPARAKPTYSSLETRALLLKHPYTIGPLPLALAADTSLRLVEIRAGPEPGAAVVKMVLPFGLVYRKPLTGCPAAFAEFLASAPAREIIERYLSRQVVQ